MVVEANAHDRARVVRRYLSALDAKKPGRTLARTAESVHYRMHQIDTELLSADPVKRLHLTQERIDLHAEHLRLSSSAGEFTELEQAFVRVARSYGERHELTFSAWRQVGVEAEVLAAAGIKASKPARPKPGTVESPPAAAVTPAEPPKQAAAKKSSGKKVAVKKVAAEAKKTTAMKNGAKTSAKEAATPPPAEAHLLS